MPVGKDVVLENRDIGDRRFEGADADDRRPQLRKRLGILGDQGRDLGGSARLVGARPDCREKIEGLSEADREKMCGLNALRLMNLDEARFRKADAA